MQKKYARDIPGKCLTLKVSANPQCPHLYHQIHQSYLELCPYHTPDHPQPLLFQSHRDLHI